MSAFGVKDERWLECRDPSWLSELASRLRRQAFAAVAIAVIAVAYYCANALIGLHASAREFGTTGGLALQRDVTVAWDRRGVPHIRAGSLHDLFFAQGFVEGSDRLFQMDLSRRYAYGTLAEIFGARALAFDEDLRAVDIRGVAQRQWLAADSYTRLALQAFSDGVNAAEDRQPLPVEFRLLLYRPARWQPQDSLAVSIVAAFELADSWHDIFARDRHWQALSRRCFELEFPLSDARYDVSLGGHALGTPDTHGTPQDCGLRVARAQMRRRFGSNAWAAGARRTATGRALIANDPHVDLTIPGIWYLVDLAAPGFHSAGAVIPGLPGVTLGHNERVAWAVTNGETATSVVYRAAALPANRRTVERFSVRFAPQVSKVYYRTRTAFTVPDDENPGRLAWVRWAPYFQTRSSIATSLELDRAQGIDEALRALSRYRGSPENVILADTAGAIAYKLAGEIPDDPSWGRYVQPASRLELPVTFIPFHDLPMRAASRSGVLLSANNRMYGPHYPYRLSPAFEPPYRAYRIATLLHSPGAYDVKRFAAMQLDTYSPIDAEIARSVARLAGGIDPTPDSLRQRELAQWDGRFERNSRAASIAYDVRASLEQDEPSLAYLLLNLRDSAPGQSEDLEPQIRAALWPARQPVHPWADLGRVQVENPLSPLLYGLLRGASLPGDGDEYSVHVQEPGFAQGFRAVWDVGDWDAGGIVIPSGESGEPGSAHYDDLATDWIDGRLVSLPFSRGAVARATAAMQILSPR